MSYIANPTDRGQTIRETAYSEDGIIVDMNAKNRVIAKGVMTSPQKVNSASGGIPVAGKSAGVVLPWSDKPGLFLETTTGKRV